MFESRSQIRVRYAETDAMGVVYHSNYLVWFEIARVAFLDEVGLPYRTLEDRGYLLPVLEAQVRYRQPARFDDRLEIRLQIDAVPDLRLPIRYRVLRDETLLAEGQTIHAFMNREGRPLRPPAFFIEALQAHSGDAAS